jgi:SSS family solute:Na+ symporter/sodium/pantothenate symporter
MPFIGGVILAAPFGAVMATVSGYLVQAASGVVQDIYHRWINPQASDRTLQRISYGCMLLIGVIAMAGAMRPPEFLQAIIVFTGGGAAAAFLFPSIMAAFWRRATSRGAVASMLAGALTVLGLYIPGWIRFLSDPTWDPGIGEKGSFYPIYLGGQAPFVWGVVASVAAGVVVSLMDRPPKPDQVERFFPAA